MPFVGLTCRPPGIGEGLSSNIDRVPKNVTKGEVPSVVKPAAYLSLKDPVCGMSGNNPLAAYSRARRHSGLFL